MATASVRTGFAMTGLRDAVRDRADDYGGATRGA